MATEEKPKRSGFALFGTGRIGSVHLRNLVLNAGRVDVRWVVEEDLQRARDLLDKYPLRHDVTVVSPKEADKVYSDPRVDVVMICTPVSTHEQIVKASLAAGKAVFCEKPFASTIEAVKSCYDVAAEKKLPLFCAFQRRYDPQCRKLYNRINSGEMGKPRVIKSTSRDPPAMMTREYLVTSGGIFLDSAVHDIDMVCWLAGDEPVSVYAAGHATNQLYAECGDVDSCVVTLRFAGGAIGSIEVSRDAHYGYDQRVEVLCTKGLLQSKNRRPVNVRQWTLDGTMADPIDVSAFERYGDGYRLELDHFLDVVEGKTSLEVTGRDTLMVNRIAFACNESLKTGKKLERRQVALTNIQWPEERKKAVSSIMTIAYMSSDEETDGRKLKKKLSWASESMYKAKERLDAHHLANAGEKTRNSLTKYAGYGAVSDRPIPENIPGWAHSP